jgi:hypothetical protein
MFYVAIVYVASGIIVTLNGEYLIVVGMLAFAAMAYAGWAHSRIEEFTKFVAGKGDIADIDKQISKVQVRIIKFEDATNKCLIGLIERMNKIDQEQEVLEQKSQACLTLEERHELHKHVTQAATLSELLDRINAIRNV